MGVQLKKMNWDKECERDLVSNLGFRITEPAFKKTTVKIIENSKEVFRLIKKEISLNVPISLMSQYSPPPKVRRHPLLSRRITPAEYREVLDYALKLGFRNLFIQEVNEYELTPDFNRENPFD